MAIRRKVTHLQLNKAYFVPGFGELKGRTLNAQFYPSIQMLMNDWGGVDCTVDFGGKSTEFSVPPGSYEIAVYAVAAIKKEEITNAKAA